MTPDELKVLGEDIIKNGLCERVAVIDGPDGKPVLIDGRNRLDAMELVGQQFTLEVVAMRLRCQEHSQDFDPYAYVTSINLHRRHLTAEQKRDLIAKLIKATPEKSNRQIAETVKVSPTTVGTVRAELEATGDVSKLDTRTDSQGREQPARKPRPERHHCRQCGVRAVVGEVRQYNTDDPYYEGDDIWLHDSCVAAFEAGEAAPHVASLSFAVKQIVAACLDQSRDAAAAFSPKSARTQILVARLSCFVLTRRDYSQSTRVR
jgi:hypothetical protein